MTQEPTERHALPAGDAWQTAIDYGIDVGQLDYLLGLSPADRLARHDQALELVRALRRAGIAHYGFHPGSAEMSDRTRR